MNETIETSKRIEGYHAEIEINEGVLSRLGFFLGRDDAEAYKVLNSEVVEILDEYNERSETEEVENTLNEEVIIAVEDKRYASTYDSIVFKLIAEVDESGYLIGNIEGI